MIRMCSQSYTCFPARGDASIPTTRPHRSRPYAVFPARGDASIPPPVPTAPAPTRLFDDGLHSIRALGHFLAQRPSRQGFWLRTGWRTSFSLVLV